MRTAPVRGARNLQRPRIGSPSDSAEQAQHQSWSRWATGPGRLARVRRAHTRATQRPSPSRPPGVRNRPPMSQPAPPSRRPRGTTREEAVAVQSRVLLPTRAQLRMRRSSSFGVGESVCAGQGSPLDAGKPARRTGTARKAGATARPGSGARLDTAPVPRGTARSALVEHARSHFELSTPAGESPTQQRRERDLKARRASYNPVIPSAAAIRQAARTTHFKVGHKALEGPPPPPRPVAKPIRCVPRVFVATQGQSCCSPEFHCCGVEPFSGPCLVHRPRPLSIAAL